MNRRQFLAVTVPPIAGTAGGCLGNGTACTDDGRWPPTVRVDEVELVPGGFAVLEIRVEAVTEFRFDTRLYRCGPTDAPVRFGDVETSPDVDSQADSCPPIWLWDDCTNVTVSAPVHVAPDAPPGEYEYGFRIGERIDDPRSREYERTLTVGEN